MKKQKKYFRGFTLVELIIVITILSILATIGFISFQGYFGNTRDSVRVSDIKIIHNGLTVYKVRTDIYPKPDNALEIKIGNILLTYQGEIGSGIINKIKINGNARDPKDNNNYIYSIDKTKKKLQLMGYLETGENIRYISQLPKIIQETYANKLDYSNRYVYVYGDKIGIITDEQKVPIQYNQEDTSSGFNILDQETGLITYFGGDVYDQGKSTSTGNKLAVQLDSGVNGTLPCSSQTYDGYTIPPLLHGETNESTKQISVSNGNQIKQFTIECKNGELDFGNAVEIILETNCTTSGYVSYNNECVENKCKNNIPNNATSNGENNEPNKNYHLISWTHNIGGGDCTYVCNSNYTYNEQNKTCDADTRNNQVCSIKPANSLYNTVSSITQTWNGATTSWEPSTSSVYNESASNTECRFKCNTGYTYDSINNVCLGNGCVTPTTATHNGIIYNLTSQNLLHGNNIEITSKNKTFGINPNDGLISAKFNFSCNAGVLTLTSTENNVGSCNNVGYDFNNNWSIPNCADTNSPTITNVTTSSPSCNTIRFTINGASDNGVGLHSTPYSFDGGLSWQANNYKDYPGTSYTISTNLIKVKDNATTPNVYTYASSINGTSSNCTCSLPWGGTINNGQNVTAYSSSSATSPTTCSSISQTRLCTNGVLSGTFTNKNCTQNYRSCTGTPWGTVAHGYSNTAYSSSSVACGSSCTSQTRTCNDGVMSGTYTNTSCNISACLCPTTVVNWGSGCSATLTAKENGLLRRAIDSTPPYTGMIDYRCNYPNWTLLSILSCNP